MEMKSPCVRHSFPFLPFRYSWQAQYMHWNLKYLCVDNTVPLITANEAPCLFHGISSERECVKSCGNHFFFASSFKTFIKTLFTPTTQWQMHLTFPVASAPPVCLVEAARPDPLAYNAPMTCGPHPGPWKLEEIQQLEDEQTKLPFRYAYWPILLSFML